MAKFVYGLNQSLDGYVDHTKIGPPPSAVFRFFIEQVRGSAGMLYGRRIYEIMRYWDDDLPEWDAEDREFAEVWRSKRKWVVSRTLKTAGPNATLIAGNVEAAIRGLKAQTEGRIDVAGTNLAGSLTDLGLIDEYRLYIHPIVLGSGTPYFAGPRPRLRLAANDRIEEMILLTYVPA